MATTISAPLQWAEKSETKTVSSTSKFSAFFNSQAKYRTGWFLLALLVQGILFLPIPAVLAYYFAASPAFVAITLVLFFSTLIAGMGGASIRTLLTLFALSIFANLVMLAVFII